jgi:Tfp pilus assembly protein PilO
MLVVSPERKTAGEQSAQLAAAQATLSSAEGSLASARAAQSQYAAAYASVVSLGKAVPPGQEVSSLIYELSQATSSKHVDFASITTGSGSAGPAAATATPVSPVAAGFTQMPFTFVFNGGFFDLEHLFQQLNHMTTRSTTGSLEVSGRLLTIQSVKLAPMSEAKGAKGGLSGTITATAYELPGGQGVAGSATPSSPTGASAPAAASSGTAASSPTAPAIARVTP